VNLFKHRLLHSDAATLARRFFLPRDRCDAKATVLVQVLCIGLPLVGAVPCGAGESVVAEWNRALGELETMEPRFAALEARRYALVHLAIEAAAQNSDAGAERDVAMGEAANTIIAAVATGHAARFATLHAAQLARIPDSREKTQGMQAGRQAAALILEQREHDGWSRAATTDIPLSSADEVARGLPAARSPWASAKPFVLRRVEQIEAPPPYTVSRQGEIEVDPRLRHARFLQRLEHTLTVEAMERFWAEPPLRAWNRIARLAAQTGGLDTAMQARLLAVLNVALADAALATAYWRFIYGTWRATMVHVWEPIPAEAAVNGDSLGFVDGRESAVREIVRRVMLPPVRNFPGVEPGLAGAAQRVLETFFPGEPVLVASAPRGGAPEAAREFSGFAAAAQEAATVEVFAGRLTREAGASGYELGRQIGDLVVQRMSPPRRATRSN
jgi:hypothetical protein